MDIQTNPNGSDSGTFAGTVVSVSQGRCKIQNGQIYDGILPKNLTLRQQSELAVGDEVISRQVDRAFCRVEKVLPRRTVLSRKDPKAPHIERIIAANIDIVVVVVSIKEPPLRLKLIDRYLVAVSAGGAKPLLCVNKIDLVHANGRRQAEDALRPYRDQGVPVAFCSAETGQGMEELKRLLSGNLCVFSGHSGVGKSSLLHALDPGSNPAVDAVRKGDRKGRHTTTASALYELADGLRVIDTPGVREFGLSRIEPSELKSYFSEFDAYATGCRFANCSHLEEPGCRVRLAVRDGLIPRARYASYRRLMGEEDAPPPAENQNPETGFRCAHCGNTVLAEGAGSSHRNHCPRCLWSLHLDNRPGDRAACCGGLMEPVAVWVREKGEWAVIHRCKECGAMASNRIAADDNETLLLSIAVRPLSMPAFSLERL
ncbi:MAG: ribosome small subunit-dependent GTPase A [Armatimonadetes bacterium]|nr:ribosome small subunit-dependent GTPase A [Armatimonadota bacterium]